MPTYRKNVTDKEQSVIEIAQFDNSPAVFVNKETHILVKAQGGTERVASDVATLNSNAGVIMPISDKSNQFTENTIGKA